MILGSEVRAAHAEMEPGCTYEDLLATLKINPETVVVLSDGDPVPLDDAIQEGEISIIRVVSSG